MPHKPDLTPGGLRKDIDKLARAFRKATSPPPPKLPRRFQAAPKRPSSRSLTPRRIKKR